MATLEYLWRAAAAPPLPSSTKLDIVPGMPPRWSRRLNNWLTQRSCPNWLARWYLGSRSLTALAWSSLEIPLTHPARKMTSPEISKQNWIPNIGKYLKTIAGIEFGDPPVMMISPNDGYDAINRRTASSLVRRWWIEVLLRSSCELPVSFFATRSKRTATGKPPILSLARKRKEVEDHQMENTEWQIFIPFFY